MSVALYNLVITEGANRDMVVPVEDGAMVIGRSSKCTLTLEGDSEISREHLRITFQQGTVMAEDLGSTHGTFLNGNPLHGAVSLAVGDSVSIGQTTFILDMPNRKPSAALANQSTEAIDSGTQSPSSLHSSATAMDSRDFEPVTRIDSEVANLEADHEGPATRVFQEDNTRMLEGAELQDLRPGQAKKVSKVRPLLGLVVILSLFVVALFVIKTRNDRRAALPTSEAFLSNTWGFGLTLPYGWTGQAGTGELVGLFRIPDPAGKKVIGQLSVFGSTSKKYEFQTIADVFPDYVTDRRKSVAGFSLLRSEFTRFGDVELVYYTYRSSEILGSGIFLIDGDRRLGLEGQARTDDWPAISDAVDDVLYSFYLVEGQKLLTYPPPNKEILALATKDSDELRKQALLKLVQGRDLLKRKDVHYSNMYMAVQAYEGCLQRCAALSAKPKFYEEAASEMITAQKAFDTLLKDQRVTILQALVVRDIPNACSECQIMLLMVPDPSDDYYQWASKQIKRYCR